MFGFDAITPTTALAAVVFGYLCGSIPFGLILTRQAGLGDVRKIGSGNIGATNVLRMGNRKIAALTLLCDALKGTVAVIAMRLYGGETAGFFAGLAAFAGHLFPVWLGFKGGKGVATYLGILFAMAWPLGLAFVAVWLALAYLFQRSSLAALTASALIPIGAMIMNLTSLVLPLVILGVAIWLTHRANIWRLLRGQEPKIDLGSKR
jgi:acyl phosphate:glycerol-3-phosphate acyltransferase